MTRLVLAVLAGVLVSAAPAHGQSFDHVASEGVELIKNDRTAGSGQGAAVAGNRLITCDSHLNLYDISVPENPVLKGTGTLDGASEGTEVVTNGKIVAIAQQGCSTGPGGCVQLFDISADTVTRLSTIPVTAFMATCVLDCRYLWLMGAQGQIFDLADPANPKEVGDFMADTERANMKTGCLQGREVKPGVVSLACEPILLVSTLAEHGGTPTQPKLLATATTPEFDYFLLGGPHASHWPRQGTDRFMLSSTETALHPQCEENIGAFVTWDATPVLGFMPGSRFRIIDLWRPSNGTYTDGRSPYNAVGCSPHFIDEHPSFRDGGLVAVATLENGIRLLQVASDGRIEERGWFLGAGGTAAVPVWHPDGKHLYIADYARGLDVVRYSGDTFVPPRAPGSAPAPGAKKPSAPARRFRVAGVSLDRKRGRATLSVEVPAAGLLEVAPKAGKRALRRVKVKAGGGGLVRVTIGATGPSKRTLRRKRKLAVSVHMTFTDADGASRFLRSRVTLRR